MAARYRLKLSKLDFISPVDTPAQETARVLLIKRAGPAKGFARVAKVDEGLGLVFCWAFTSTRPDGSAYHDLQGDCIDEGSFVKAAAEFMAGERATDEMHDGKPSGYVAFAMPMTPEIAKAFGVETKTIGLMVALKPPADVLEKFKIGEYTGVSIAGLGVREPVGKAAARIGKRTVLTSITDGHQHGIELSDPTSSWSSQLTTTYGTSEGATDGHCHAWVYDATTGAITVAMDAGHDHTVEAVVPPEVIAEAMRDDGDDAEAVPEHVSDEKPSGGTSVVVVSAHAPAGNSTPAGPARTVKAQEPNHMPIRKMLATALALTTTQRDHLFTLTPETAEEYLGTSLTERDAIAKAAADANPVVHTATDGTVYRKSDDPRLVAMAKRNDETVQQLAVEKAAREQVELEKRAGVELSHFAKGVNVRAAIIKAIDGIADEAVRKEALEAMKSANAAMQALGKAAGVGSDAAPVNDDPVAKFNTARVEFAKSKLKTDAPSDAQVRSVTGEFINTDSGAELYAAAYPTKTA